MNDGDAVALTGTVRVRGALAGSRSERPQPVLVDEKGAVFPLFLVGENPFEQPTLNALEGRRVSVRGRVRNGTVRVEPADLRVEEP